MASEAARQQVRIFRQDYPETAMVFTTGDLSLGGDLGIEKKLEMQPLRSSQMQEFVCAYLPEDGEKLWQQLQGRLRELGETPMFLLMLCSVFGYNKVIPAHLGLVWRSFTRSYRSRLKQDVPVDESSRRWWDWLLQELAWVMTNGESKTEIMVAISRQKAEEVLTEFLRGKVIAPTDCAMRWLEDLLEHHLIQVGDDGQISFHHRLLQEYYTAERLLSQLSGLSDYELQWDYFNYLKWTEVVALMLGLVEDEMLAVRVVRLALEVDWFLGARLVGEVQRRFQEQAFVEVERLELPWLLKIYLLGLTKSDVAIPKLVKCLEDSDYGVCCIAAKALGEIGSESAIPGLVPLLEDPNIDVQIRAAESLGKIGTVPEKSETVVPALIQLLLESDESRVCAKVVEALRKIGSKTAIPGLIKFVLGVSSNREFFVEHSDNYLYSIGAKALRQIGLEIADISELIQDLEDEDSRYYATYHLGRIGSEIAVPRLIQILKDETPKCTLIIEALGEIGSETAVPALIELLADEDFLKDENFNDFYHGVNVRKSVAEALGEIGSENAIPALIELLENPHKDVRMSAVCALGRIGSQTAVPRLIELLEDPDKDVYISTIYALGYIGSETALPRLIQLLEDPDKDVYISTIYALGNIGSEIALPRLIQLLEYPDKDVHRSTIYALGNIGSETAFLRLIQLLEEDLKIIFPLKRIKDVDKFGSETILLQLIRLLEHSKPIICNFAAKALSKIDSQTAIPALIKLLENPDKNVHKTAVIALGEIGLETIIPELIKILEDSDKNGDRRAVIALGKIGSEHTITKLTQKLQNDSFVKQSLSETINIIQAIQKRLRYYKPTPQNIPPEGTKTFVNSEKNL